MYGASRVPANKIQNKQITVFTSALQRDNYRNDFGAFSGFKCDIGIKIEESAKQILLPASYLKRCAIIWNAMKIDSFE